ncbi:unnamed protein product, partial [Ectocarpus sp. 12 AP-2014]
LHTDVVEDTGPSAPFSSSVLNKFSEIADYRRRIIRNFGLGMGPHYCYMVGHG